MTTQSAHILLDKYSELKYRIQSHPDWQEYLNKGNSLTLLYGQFHSLLLIVGVQVVEESPAKTLLAFEGGSFIKDRSLDKYSPVLAELEEKFPELADYTFWKHDNYKYWQLTNLFCSLLEFKRDTTFRYFGAVEGLEVGGQYAYNLKKKSLNGEIVDKTINLLISLIDPEKKTFDLDKLIETYNYPEDDYNAMLRNEILYGE